MKKIASLLIAIIAVFTAHAQLLNPGFESIDNILHTPANWRPQTFMVIIVDSSCLSKGGDSTYFATRDAHSGTYAAELRTAINCNVPYSGQMQQMRFRADTFADQRVPFHQRPNAFTFYYKLRPVGGDGARVQISLEKENGFVVADAGMTIYDDNAIYRKAIIPLSYRSGDMPEFVNIKFQLHSDSVLHFGSRLLIDDIGLATTAVNEISAGALVRCYPQPVTNEMNINISGLKTDVQGILRITDISGRLLMSETVTFQNGNAHINTQSFINGVYFIYTEVNNQKYTARFVK